MTNTRDGARVPPKTAGMNEGHTAQLGAHSSAPLVHRLDRNLRLFAEAVPFTEINEVFVQRS